MIGQTIVLTGKTLKGKNRVRELGDVWDVINQTDEKLLIQPIEKRSPAIILRWIQRENDPDFSWVSRLPLVRG